MSMKAFATTLQRLTISTSFLLLLAISTSPRDASAQAHAMTLEELTKTSTSVVLGTAEAPRSFWNDKRTLILTEVKIRVDQSVKGAVDGETVVTIPGGSVGNTTYEVSDMPVFVDGEQVLVFLWEHPSGEQLVTGGALGKLEVVEDEGGGQPLLRGAAPLLKDIASLGKTAAQDEITLVSSGDVPVEDVLAQIKAFVNE